MEGEHREYPGFLLANWFPVYPPHTLQDRNIALAWQQQVEHGPVARSSEGAPSAHRRGPPGVQRGARGDGLRPRRRRAVAGCQRWNQPATTTTAATTATTTAAAAAATATAASRFCG